MTPPLPAVSTQCSRSAIDELIARASPAVRNPAGTLVAVDAAWAEEISDDSQRLALLPAALTALGEAHEVWAFHERGASDRIEHQPHLLWCHLDDLPERELVVAGTRRVQGALHLHSWFRMAEPLEVLARYLRRGARLFPPLRVRATYHERIDVLYLRPEPSTSYRVVRISPDVPVYAYLACDRGYPRLAGFELQDVEDVGRRLLEDVALGSLLATATEIDGETSTLGEHLMRLIGAEETR